MTGQFDSFRESERKQIILEIKYENVIKYTVH